MKITTSTGLVVENFASTSDGHYPFHVWKDGQLLAKGSAKQGGGGWMRLVYVMLDGVRRQTSQRGHVNDRDAELAEVIAKGWVRLREIEELADRHVAALRRIAPRSNAEPAVPVLSYPSREDFRAISQEAELQWEDHCTLMMEVGRRAQDEGIRIVEVPATADEFENWLKAKGLKNSSGVRARYAAEHAPRPGAPVGNKNAQKKDEPLAGIVTFRCMRVEKAAWVRAARQKGLSLSAWLTEVANEAVKKV